MYFVKYAITEYEHAVGYTKKYNRNTIYIQILIKIACIGLSGQVFQT